MNVYWFFNSQDKPMMILETCHVNTEVFSYFSILKVPLMICITTFAKSLILAYLYF